MIKFLSYATLLTVFSCGSTIDDVSSERVDSNVPVTDEEGVVSATAQANGLTTIVASSNSEAKESSVSIPAGALKIDTKIEMGDAKEDSADILSALSINTTDNAVVQKSSPLYVAPSGDPTTITGSLSIATPLPITSKDLGLTATSGKLVYIYVIYTSEGYRAGIKSLTAANLVGTFVKADFKGFGYFQIAFLAKEVEDSEVAYTKPSLD